MIFLRSSIYFLFLLLNTILIAGIGSLIGWAIPKDKLPLLDGFWSRVNLWGLSAICGLNYRLKGEENIPQEPCIVFAKHQSAWETIALISLIPGRKSWVLKRELLFVPFFGWVMWYFKPIAINRKAGRKAIDQIIQQGKERLDSGCKIIIFPEGTRVAPGARRKYGVGGALLAEKTGRPVLPLAHNAGVFWRRRDLRKYPGTIDVVIGPLFQTQGMNANGINAKAEAWIESAMNDLPGENSEAGKARSDLA